MTKEPSAFESAATLRTVVESQPISRCRNKTTRNPSTKLWNSIVYTLQKIACLGITCFYILVRARQMLCSKFLLLGTTSSAKPLEMFFVNTGRGFTNPRGHGERFLEINLRLSRRASGMCPCNCIASPNPLEFNFTIARAEY